MTKQILVVLIAFAVAAVGLPATAQDQPETEEKVFNLIVGADAEEAEEVEVEETVRWEPRMEAGRWNLSLTLGFQVASGTYLSHPNLIYRVDEENFYYGDVEIAAESAFNPILRINYNLTPWFALETSMGIAFSEYTASVTDAYEVNQIAQTDPIAIEALGPFDREHRSTIQTVASLSGLLFPLNLKNDGDGRWHPYLTGGVGIVSYSLDSDYTDTASSSLNVNLGLGLMLIADDVLTVRAEMGYLVNSIEVEPGRVFQERNAGTVQIPVYEFTDFGRATEVESFGSNTLNSLVWQLGAQLSF